MNATATTADVIGEMMTAWNTIQTKVSAAFPQASDEERYEICAAAMNKALGL